MPSLHLAQTDRFRPATLGSAAFVLLVGLVGTSCFPVVTTERVPSVAEDAMHRSQASLEVEVLALVVWRDGTYRWSSGEEKKEPFLTRPVVLDARDLARLHQLSPGRTNTGAVAWDGHGGTHRDDKEPSHLFVVWPSGHVDWLMYAKASATKQGAKWVWNGWAELSEAWTAGLRTMSDECEHLVRGGEACPLQDSLFDRALHGNDELLFDFSRSKGRGVERFLDSHSQRSSTGPSGKWRSSGDPGPN